MGLLQREDFEEFLKAWEDSTQSKTEAGIIGGCALMYQGLRTLTKDIDVCFFDIATLQRSEEFLQRYAKEHQIRIDYGLPQRFGTMLLNEDMFNTELAAFRPQSAERTLHLRVPSPEYFALIKVEAGIMRSYHFEDAKELVKRHSIPCQAMIDAYREYKPEIECNPRMKGIFNMFMRDAYSKKFDIDEELGEK